MVTYDGATGFPLHLNPALRYRRFLTTKDLPQFGAGLCRWCGGAVVSPRRSWCSNDCVNAFKIRAWQDAIRTVLYRRDRGVCSACGIDTVEIEALRQRIRAIHNSDATSPQWGRWAQYNSTWEADHILPVHHGGGCCGPENYRTLCWRCHAAETAALAASRADARREFRLLLSGGGKP